MTDGPSGSAGSSGAPASAGIASGSSAGAVSSMTIWTGSIYTSCSCSGTAASSGTTASTGATASTGTASTGTASTGTASGSAASSAGDRYIPATDSVCVSSNVIAGRIKAYVVTNTTRQARKPVTYRAVLSHFLFTILLKKLNIVLPPFLACWIFVPFDVRL